MNQIYALLKDAAKVHVETFVRKQAQLLQSGSRILDAGAGECVYKKYFSHCQYVAVDAAVGDADWDYSHLDFVAPLDKLPFEAKEFDAILCTEVIEHLDDPLRCLSEMSRVLKDGGVLMVTVPFFHHEHQTPYDFFRYTSYGLKVLLERAGFASGKIKVQPFGGVFLRWSYELTSLFEIFPGIRLGRRMKSPQDLLLMPLRGLILLLIRSLQLVLLGLDKFDKRRIAPFGWSVEAYKAS